MKNIENYIFGAIAVALVLGIVLPLYLMVRPYTAEKLASMKLNCESNGQMLYVDSRGVQAYCKEKPDEVKECIRLWVESVDEKYNNPDTVSNLHDTSYADVVKQCEETFGSR